MIKKLLILAVLAGLGYVGWLAWTEYLSPRDKARIERKLDSAAARLKQGAAKMAKKAAQAVHENLAEEDSGKPQPADAGAPAPDSPSKN